MHSDTAKQRQHTQDIISRTSVLQLLHPASRASGRGGGGGLPVGPGGPPPGGAPLGPPVAVCARLPVYLLYYIYDNI